MRGGGAMGADGLGGAAGICVTLLFKALDTFVVVLGTVGGAAAAEGGVARAGAAIGGGAALVEDGALAAVGVAGVFGGITTTDGGR